MRPVVPLRRPPVSGSDVTARRGPSRAARVPAGTCSLRCAACGSAPTAGGRSPTSSRPTGGSGSSCRRPPIRAWRYAPVRRSSRPTASRCSRTARPSRPTRCWSAASRPSRCTRPRASPTSSRSAGRTVPSLYDPFVDRPAPLVDRDRRLEVRERLAADGAVLVPYVDGSAPAVPAGTDAVAVCLLHSDLNPVHEAALAAELRGRGLDVCASYEVSPVMREYERTVTTVVNAALRPVCRPVPHRPGRRGRRGRGDDLGRRSPRRRRVPPSSPRRCCSPVRPPGHAPRPRSRAPAGIPTR